MVHYRILVKSGEKRTGAIYVAFGEYARQEAARSIKRLPRELSVSVIGDQPLIGNGVSFIPFDEPGPGARYAKLGVDQLSPYHYTLYLDADTRPQTSDILRGFEILADGWELVLAHSSRQGYDVLGHIGKGERTNTLSEISNHEPLALQAGVMFFRQCKSIHRLFGTWRREWSRWEDQDQAALLRALKLSPVRIWLLGLPWNLEHGEVIQHKFGRVRR